jgi:tetratricopeptide (TPR) repeat protein
MERRRVQNCVPACSFAAAVLAGEQGDYASARQLFEESLETCLELNDNRGVAVALNALAVNARDRGDLPAASLLFERCVAIWKDLGDSADIARALSNLANVTKLQGEYARASSLYDECLTMFRKAGDGAGVAWTLNYQGDVAREKADLAAARSFCEQSLAAFRQLRDGWGIASALSDLASLSCDQGHDAKVAVFMVKASRCSRNWATNEASPGRSNVSQQVPRRNRTPSNRCIWQEPPPHFANDWARPHAYRTTTSGEGLGICAPNAGQRCRSDSLDGGLGDADRQCHP